MRPEGLSPVVGGLTGHTFRARLAGEAVLVKVPAAGEGAAAGRREHDGLLWAVEQGLAPPPVHFDPEHGALVLRWLRGRACAGTTWSPPMLCRIGGLLRLIHAGPPVMPTLDPCATTRAAAERLRGDLRLAPHVASVRSTLEELATLLAQDPAPARPCHTDFHGGNLVDDGRHLWPIDWASLAMADPLWDLAYFARCSHLDAAAVRLLLHAYDGHATPRTHARLRAWCAVADACLYLWCLEHLRAGGGKNAFTCSLRVFGERYRAATAPERLAALRQALLRRASGAVTSRV
jgi:thiamine kinase-like enzyme